MSNRLSVPSPTSALIIVAACLLLVAVLPGAATADPPATPRHDLNETTFNSLWSLDQEGEISDAETASEVLRNSTDVSFDTPPEAPEEWNRKEIDRFPGGDSTDTSVHPDGANLQDGNWIKDAYVSVFAVQPSTVLHRGGDEPTHYTGSEGTVTGTADYRVTLPDGSSSQERRVDWSIHDHSVTEADVMIGGRIGNTFGRQQLSDANPGNVIRGEYTGAEEGMTELGLRATIEVTLEKHVETRSCHTDDDGDTDCSDWSSDYSYPSETVTVDDYEDTSYYSTQTSVYHTYNPVEEEMRLVVGGGRPYNGITLPGGDRALGVWSYYTARDTAWDTLDKSTASGEQTIHSPIHPVTTHAYPSQAGIRTAGPRGSLEPAQIDIYYQSGESQPAPDLPANVNVPVASDSYNLSRQIAVSSTTNQPSEVEVEGIVRGTTSDLKASDPFYTEIPTVEPEIETETTRIDDGIQLDVSLTAPDGTPISTDQTNDYLSVRGRDFETGSDGTATLTLSQSDFPAYVSYTPTYFWDRADVAYAATSTRVNSQTTIPSLMEPTFKIIFWFLILLSPFYVSDKAYGTNFWPPWRGIW